MSLDSKDASSVSSQSSSSGTGENSSSADNSSSNSSTENRVAYETHRRLLDEKKKLQEKYEVLAAEKAQREHKELEDKGEYQKIIEIERQQKAAAESKLAELQDTFLRGKKVKAFLSALGTGLDEKYYGFIDLEQIAVDPESKEINMTSVASVAESFKKSYPEILRPKNATNLPDAAPAGNSANTIAHSEWIKLSSKEMMKYKPSQILGG